MQKRWKVTCSYDGTDFCGWQVQPNGISVQELIEKRLEIIFKTPIRIHGSGRTDAGVHAAGQVFHFDADWKYEADKLMRAIQSTLPESIRLNQIQSVSQTFHARFSATGKRYQYRIYKGLAYPEHARFCWSLGYANRLDLTKMHSALGRVLGWHDFKAFSVNRGEPYENTWRCLSKAELKNSPTQLLLTFEGNGFLYKMVRGLTGAIVGIGSGQLEMDDFDALLTGTNRKSLVTTAPSKGLSLCKVYYKRKQYPKPPNSALPLKESSDG